MNTRNIPTDERSGYGKAFGLAVASAAIIGTAVSTMFGKKETRKDKALREVEERLSAIESTASQSLEQLANVVQGLRAQATGAGTRTSRRRANQVSKATTRMADQAAAALSARAKDLEKETRKIKVTESMHGLGNDLSRRATNLTHVLNERGADLVEETRSLAPAWKSKAAKSLTDTRDQSRKLAQAVRDENATLGRKAQGTVADISDTGAHLVADARSQVGVIRERASKAADEATALGATYASQARGRAPEVRQQASHLAEQIREKAPDVQERASQVAARIGEKAAQATELAREKGPGLLESAGHQLGSLLEGAQESARPRVDDAAEHARQATKRLSTDVLPTVQHKAAHLTEVIDAQTHAATDRIAHTTSAVEQGSRRAASAAGEGGKNLGSLIGWSSAAAGVVYYAFLNDGQRAKVRDSGGRILAEARAVIRDIRGQDGQFK